MPPEPGPLPSTPAALRNREAILGQLIEEGLDRGGLLEIASGTGEHAVLFASRCPGLRILPSEADPLLVEAIAERVRQAALPNLAPPARLDVTAPQHWPAGPFDAVLAINLLHIAPFGVARALFIQAARVLGPNGSLVVYGPFILPEAPLEPTNAAFHAALRARDPAFGLRSVAALDHLAAARGFAAARIRHLPANNRLLLWRRDLESRVGKATGAG
jgi:SAM-dependent methyltransferase